MVAGFDSLLKHDLGHNLGWGRWQLLFVSSIIAASLISLQNFTQFGFLVPQHHCRQPQLVNWSHAQILNLSIPLKPEMSPAGEKRFLSCREFDLDSLWTHLSPNSTLDDALRERNLLYPNLTIRKCQHGVDFDLSTAFVGKTFGEDFQVVCDRQYLIPLSNAGYMFGMMVGAFLAGPLGDHFGRRPICLVFSTSYISVGLLTSLSNGVWTFIFLRFLTGAAFTINLVAYTVLIVEWTEEEQRNIFGLLSRIYVGAVCRTFIVLCFHSMPSWRSAYALNFLTTLPALSGYFLWLESPRWLLSRGRDHAAFLLLARVAQFNGRPLDEAQRTLVSRRLRDLTNVAATEHRSSFRDSLRLLLCAPSYRRRLMLAAVIWLLQMLVVVGLTFYTVRLGGNPLINALLSGVVMVPGAILQFLLYRFFDRKRPLIILYALGSVCLLTAFVLMVTGTRGSPVVAAASMALLFSSCIVHMLHIRTPEIFPTGVRSTCLGVCSSLSRVGMITGAYVERLDQEWFPLPMLVFLMGNVMATVTTVFLPEGFGQLEEWQEEGRGEKGREEEKGEEKTGLRCEGEENKERREEEV